VGGSAIGREKNINTFPLLKIIRSEGFDDVGLIASEAASLGKGLPTFRKNAMLSSRLKVFLADQKTHRHIPADQKRQLFHYESLKTHSR
jgi:hypothetical protein